MRYILKKNCPNIGKEIGDYYNNEYADNVENLIKKGIIEEEIEEADESYADHLESLN